MSLTLSREFVPNETRLRPRARGSARGGPVFSDHGAKDLRGLSARPEQLGGPSTHAGRLRDMAKQCDTYSPGEDVLFAFEEVSAGRGMVLSVLSKHRVSGQDVSAAGQKTVSIHSPTIQLTL